MAVRIYEFMKNVTSTSRVTVIVKIEIKQTQGNSFVGGGRISHYQAPFGHVAIFYIIVQAEPNPRT